MEYSTKIKLIAIFAISGAVGGVILGIGLAISEGFSLGESLLVILFIALLGMLAGLIFPSLWTALKWACSCSFSFFWFLGSEHGKMSSCFCACTFGLLAFPFCLFAGILATPVISIVKFVRLVRGTTIEQLIDAQTEFLKETIEDDLPQGMKDTKRKAFEGDADAQYSIALHYDRIHHKIDDIRVFMALDKDAKAYVYACSRVCADFMRKARTQGHDKATKWLSDNW